ncbi:Gfo/Idh/MocA family oxidoreductase [Paenibacillus sp. YPG26]|uniref:Gfo/Idh/MocA family protein n=1 Tax=Paenibacillus sp. YPG26 TaxID=2878915 RepID=UPI002040577F|nr:Gfo/Idh/MocA family oxidoreductase [Paenibacillus sp. YPG26]USB32169.1 Gfo/Idh/MocA family oxidoreductase [Paenibacillus sp. YPG26]
MDEQLRWGIMGCAGIARDCIMPAIMNSTNGTIEAVASRGVEKSRALADQFGVQKAYGSYEELLQDSSVDAVYIPLPNHLHKEWTIKASQAGKHVLCEKPFSLDAWEAELMIKACSDAGVLLAEAMMYRHHPVLRRAQQLVAGGGIGELRLIRASFTYNNPDQADNIRFRSAWGGGAIYDVGGYPLSAARFFTGMEPEAVTVNSFFSGGHDGVDMMSSGLVEFAGGLAMTFDCGMWAEERRCLEIVGSEGRIEIPHAFSGKEQSGYYLFSRGELQEYRETEINAYVRQIEDFGKAAFGHMPQLFLPEDALRNMKLLDACRLSAAERRRVELR